MKKIIIVNNNMKVGGVQKSLYNLLWEIEGQYDITLLLFRAVGEYIDQLPDSVKVIEADSLFRYLGISQGECRGIDALKRGMLASFCRLFGRSAVMKILCASQKTPSTQYDSAISFLHNGGRKSFYGGVQDFVLNCVDAKRKIAFLHCDYRNCGAAHPDNNRMLEEFDAIAACSDGCRRAFESVLPNLKDKCMTVRNCHRFDEISELAQSDPVSYDGAYVNLLVVARLSHEKGIERAIEAVACAHGKGLPVRLHIVGDGAMKESLRTLVHERKLGDQVVFYGQQSNPYRYMINADLLLIPSYHEAAPMVIDEARSLGLPVLTTRTTSSKEMVEDADCGWVCENEQDALDEALCKIAADRDGLADLKRRLTTRSADNKLAAAQFDSLVKQ